MKSNSLYAAALVTALAASAAPSVQAHIIYQADPESTCCAAFGYNPGLDEPSTNTTYDIYGFGDYIKFGGTARNLNQVTFQFTTSATDLNLSSLGLGVKIYNTNGTLLAKSTTLSDNLLSGTESISFSNFTGNLHLPDEIVYLVGIDTLPTLGITLTLGLSKTSPSPSGAADATGSVSLEAGQTVSLNTKSILGDADKITPSTSGPVPLKLATDNYGIAVTVDAIPEPASLALLSIGLVGLGCMRRRKAA